MPVYARAPGARMTHPSWPAETREDAAPKKERDKPPQKNGISIFFTSLPLSLSISLSLSLPLNLTLWNPLHAPRLSSLSAVLLRIVTPVRRRRYFKFQACKAMRDPDAGQICPNPTQDNMCSAIMLWRVYGNLAKSL